jgi:hypothetical protein
MRHGQKKREPEGSRRHFRVVTELSAYGSMEPEPLVLPDAEARPEARPSREASTLALPLAETPALALARAWRGGRASESSWFSVAVGCVSINASPSPLAAPARLALPDC